MNHVAFGLIAEALRLSCLGVDSINVDLTGALLLRLQWLPSKEGRKVAESFTLQPMNMAICIGVKSECSKANKSMTRFVLR